MLAGGPARLWLRRLAASILQVGAKGLLKVTEYPNEVVRSASSVAMTSQTSPWVL